MNGMQRVPRVLAVVPWLLGPRHASTVSAKMGPVSGHEIAPRWWGERWGGLCADLRTARSRFAIVEGLIDSGVLDRLKAEVAQVVSVGEVAAGAANPGSVVDGLLIHGRLFFSPISRCCFRQNSNWIQSSCFISSRIAERSLFFGQAALLRAGSPTVDRDAATTSTNPCVTY